ncbi:MAG: AsmA family protein, partial [Bacteroidota bacterium]
MKFVKRFMLVIIVLLVLVIGALAAIPYFYKDEILAFAKEEINNTVNAKVDFEDFSLSIFKSFPDLTMGLEGLSVIGIDRFEDVPLVGADALELTVDLYSVISGNGPLQIESVRMNAPKVNVMVLKDGAANYDIAKPAATPEAPKEEAPAADYSGFKLQLKEYSISDGDITYDDQNGNIFLNIKDLDHSGSGDFTLDVYDLDTETTIEALTFKQGGTALLSSAAVALDAIFNIDTKNSKYTLKDNTLNLNALTLNADGFVQLLEEGMELDMKLNAPQNDFKSLLSMVPNAYIKGYEDVKAAGQFNLAVETKGQYIAEKEVYPTFKVNLEVDNGTVKYPDLPLGIDNIFTKVAINSPTSRLNDMVVDVNRFALKIGNNPFDARFRLKTPISDPDVDAKVKGKVDLDQLAKAFPIEGVEQLSGLITADVTAKTRMSYIDQQAYEKVQMDGDLKVENIKVQSAGQPEINIRNMDLSFSPKFVALNAFAANLGKSDLAASGRIDNILAYFSPEKTMTGDLKVRSQVFDLNEWVPATATEATATPQPQAAASDEQTAETEIFDRFDFKLDAEVDQIKYEDYDIHQAVAKGHFTPEKLEVSALGTNIGDSDLMGSGVLTNIFGY